MTESSNNFQAVVYNLLHIYYNSPLICLYVCRCLQTTGRNSCLVVTRLGRNLKLFVSTVVSFPDAFASQLGLANFLQAKTPKNERKNRVFS